jgi:hypothetical protein
MGVLILVGLGAAAAYAGSLYLWPFRPCGRCSGTGRSKGSSRKRYGLCPRCHGSGRRRRLGARTVHRGALSIRRNRSRKDID